MKWWAYNNISEKRFKCLATVFCFLGDLQVGLYLYRKFSDFDQFQKILKTYADAGLLEEGNIPLDFYRNLFQLALSSLLLFIGLMILFHLFIYLLYYGNKAMAMMVAYLKLLTWVGAIGSFLLGVTSLASPSLTLLFIPQGGLYLYAAMGLSFFHGKHSHKAQ